MMEARFPDLGALINAIDKQIMEAERQKNSVQANAKQLREIHQSYISAGFTEAQAWELFIACIKSSGRGSC